MSANFCVSPAFVKHMLLHAMMPIYLEALLICSYVSSFSALQLFRYINLNFIQSMRNFFIWLNERFPFLS